MSFETDNHPAGGQPLPVRESPEPLRILLLLGLAFFSSWGPGLQKVSALNLSKFFPAFAVATVCYWAVFGRDRFKSFSPLFNFFFIFVLIHTMVCYVFFHPGEIRFGYGGALYSQAGYILVAPTRGIMVVRFFLFYLTAYAVSSLLRNRREFFLFARLYGAGFLISILLGGHKTLDLTQGFARSTGGFLNPNSLGIAALFCCFLNLAVFLDERVPSRGKGLSLVFILAGIYGMMASVSRNTVVAFACGALMVSLYLPLMKKTRWAVFVILLLAVAAALLPSSVYRTLTSRITVENIKQSNWSMRQDIWSDYLRQADSYFFAGLGLDRSVEAVRETYTTDSTKPLFPHQTYFQVLVEFGIIGLLLFLAALWAMLRKGFESASPKPEGRQSVVMLGLLVALVFYGFTGGILGERTLWMALGVVAFVHSHPEIGRRPESGT